MILQWEDIATVPIWEELLLLVKTGDEKLYTTTAWLNEHGEWVDIPKPHSPIGWAYIPEHLEEEICSLKWNDKWKS